MIRANILQVKNPARSWMLWGILIIGIVGSMMHFVYVWSGNSTAIGIFAPINESVWEHLKMSFWTMLVWWIFGYFICSKSQRISAAQWFASCTSAMLVCPLVIVSFFYTYTGAFGMESLILDIFSFFLGVSAAQGIALHLYRHARLTNNWIFAAVVILALLAAMFTVFTFAPPHIPIFMDSPTGQYGIRSI